MWIRHGRLSLREEGEINPYASRFYRNPRRIIFDQNCNISNSIRAWTLFLSFVFIFIFPNLSGTCKALETSIKVNVNGNKSIDELIIPIGIQTEKPRYRVNQNKSIVFNRFANARRVSRNDLWTNGDSGFFGESNFGNEDEGLRFWRNGPCTCWNTTDGSGTREVECKCSGPSMTRLTTTLLSDVYRLTIEHAKNFMTLSNEDLLPFANSLGELIFTELPEFKEIKNGTFYGMRKLNAIVIHGARALTEIPDDVFKVFLPKLKLIRITYSSLKVVPNFSQLHVTDAFHMVELENNKISKLIPGSFANLKTEHLILSYNDIREIGPRAFEGSTIARLTLKGNRQLTSLHPDSFVGIESLRVLDLSETAITFLPTHGLKGLESLRLEKVLSLSVIPSIYHFESLKEALLTWSYHCCAFEFPETHDPIAFQAYKEFIRNTVSEMCKNLHASTTEPTITSETTSKVNPTATNINNQVGRRRRRQVSEKTEIRPFGKSNATEVTNDLDSEGQYYISDDPNEENQGSDQHFDSYDPFVFDPERSFGTVFNPNELERASDLAKNDWSKFGHSSEAEFEDDIGVFHPSVTPSQAVYTLCGNVSVRKPPKVTCTPLPDAFNPCEDIMGSFWLRGAVWIVVSLALVGNTVVLVVLLLAPGRMTVQRFLMANLSWADLCMGIYLLMVATEDLVSLGSYFNYAIDWQLGWGCQIAGFLTVFASELSVFTLMVITGERWYALTRAIHLTKRLNIVGAAQLMSLGWILAIILAGLPLIGVSSYSKTSICLPMEAGSTGAVVYLSFLLLFNGLAFILVATAYLQMYRAVAGHGGGAAAAPGASSADTAIAKKMALLVFTDFSCWAPVAFFGLTAVGGYPLIGVTDSKILLVFFYPLNSTLNPYLYAIMTKQYRRDLLLLLSRHGMCTRRAARYKTGQSTNNTLQTMNTVLRLGSVTETKVASLHRHPSPNGGGRASTKENSDGCGNTIGLNGESQSKVSSNDDGIVRNNTSSHIFDHPLLPTISNIERAEEHNSKRNYSHSEDEDHLNGVVGRNIAETSFIRVPSKGRGNVSSGDVTSGIKLINEDRTLDEDHDIDHEISEYTPFCRTNNSPQ